MTYWWLSVVLAILMVGMNLILFKVMKDKQKRTDLTIFIIGIYLLLYKIGEYTVWQAKGFHYKVPIEFSAVSYFLFGISVFVKWKPLKDFSAFSATLAGFIYYLSLIAAPDTFVANRDSVFLFLAAILNHSLLYFGGMLRLSSRSFTRHFLWQAPLGTGILIGYSYFMVWLVKSPENVMLINACDGTLLDGVLNVQKNAIFYTLYYVILFILVIFILGMFYFLNQKFIHGWKYKIAWKTLFLQNKSAASTEVNEVERFPDGNASDDTTSPEDTSSDDTTPSAE